MLQRSTSKKIAYHQERLGRYFRTFSDLRTFSNLVVTGVAENNWIALSAHQTGRGLKEKSSKCPRACVSVNTSLHTTTRTCCVKSPTGAFNFPYMSNSLHVPRLPGCQPSVSSQWNVNIFLLTLIVHWQPCPLGIELESAFLDAEGEATRPMYRPSCVQRGDPVSER